MGKAILFLSLILLASCGSVPVKYDPAAHCDNAAMQIAPEKRFRTLMGHKVVDEASADTALKASYECGAYHRDVVEDLLKERKEYCGLQCKAGWFFGGAGVGAVVALIAPLF